MTQKSEHRPTKQILKVSSLNTINKYDEEYQQRLVINKSGLVSVGNFLMKYVYLIWTIQIVNNNMNCTRLG